MPAADGTLMPADDGPAPDLGRGWRASKRTSKLGKKLRREARAKERRERVGDGVRSVGRGVLNVLRIVAIAVIVTALFAGALLAAASGINSMARWSARRAAEQSAAPEARVEQARENLLIIGVTSDTSAEFLAVRLDEANGQILGIAIPSGAFMEVPGQGFERVGASWSAGPAVSMAAVSNYLSVPFEHHVVVDVRVYQDALTNVSLRDLMDNVQSTDLSDEEFAAVRAFVAGVSGERTALIPLPVKPIDLGGSTYFEPQRDQIADLLFQWWGVTANGDAAVRVIIYNGVGTPGIGGLAAQQLISAGFRVVDTKNADNFDYLTTTIVVQSGRLEHGQAVRDALGVGDVMQQSSDQDVADVIVIIGQDYVPADDGT